jgi:hypothetical protein
MQGPTDDAFVAPFDLMIPFDANGEITLILPANDDPQWSASSYRIIVSSEGDKEPLRRRLVVPYQGTGIVDLADVLNVPDPPKPMTSFVLLASKGVAGGVASLDNTGRVPASQLPSSSGGSLSWLDLTDKPSTFPPSSHTHVMSDVTGLDSVLSSKADLVGGVLPTSQLPALAVVDFLGSVSVGPAMLALTGQKGDWCIRTDLGQVFVITGSDPTQLSSWTAMPLGPVQVQSVNGQTGTVVLAKGDVGLGNVDNTSDANKPVSTAQQTALNLKANLASPTFTGTVSGVTAAMVGLGNIDNTSDANKPVSTAQQTALNLKANLASPTFTGTVSGISKSMVGLGNVDNTADSAKSFTASQISDSTTTGRSVVTAANAAAARSAIGAGTSDLALGSSSTTALAGDSLTTHVAASDPHTQYGRIFTWNGSAYVVSTTADIYIGPGDPGSIDGLWIDSDA